MKAIPEVVSHSHTYTSGMEYPMSSGGVEVDTLQRQGTALWAVRTWLSCGEIQLSQPGDGKLGVVEVFVDIFLF